MQQPATAFVGRFVLQGNLLPAKRKGNLIETPLGSLDCRPAQPTNLAPADSEPLEVLVSPDGIELQLDPQGEAWLQGREFLGREWLYQVQLGELKLRLRLPLEAEYGRGQRCQLQLRPGTPAMLFPSRQPLQALG